MLLRVGSGVVGHTLGIRLTARRRDGHVARLEAVEGGRDLPAAGTDAPARRRHIPGAWVIGRPGLWWSVRALLSVRRMDHPLMMSVTFLGNGQMISLHPVVGEVRPRLPREEILLVAPHKSVRDDMLNYHTGCQPTAWCPMSLCRRRRRVVPPWRGLTAVRGNRHACHSSSTQTAPASCRDGKGAGSSD